MGSQHQAIGSQQMPQQVYTGCSREELITIGMEAWKRGYERAVADDAAVMRDLLMVEQASEAACDEALLVYFPMELDRFRDIFTLTWCSGYWTRVKEPRIAAS